MEFETLVGCQGGTLYQCTGNRIIYRLKKKAKNQNCEIALKCENPECSGTAIVRGNLLFEIIPHCIIHSSAQEQRNLQIKRVECEFRESLRRACLVINFHIIIV
jgi:hypothetical protein